MDDRSRRPESETINPYERADSHDLPHWKAVNLLVSVDHGDLGEATLKKPLAFDATSDGIAV